MKRITLSLLMVMSIFSASSAWAADVKPARPAGTEAVAQQLERTGHPLVANLVRLLQPCDTKGPNNFAMCAEQVDSAAFALSLYGGGGARRGGGK